LYRELYKATVRSTTPCFTPLCIILLLGYNILWIKKILNESIIFIVVLKIRFSNSQVICYLWLCVTTHSRVWSTNQTALGYNKWEMVVLHCCFQKHLTSFYITEILYINKIIIFFSVKWTWNVNLKYHQP